MVVKASQEGKDTVELSIVVPVYNEGESIEELYSELRGTLDTLDKVWEIILVDDGSTDTSPPRIADLSAHDQRVRIVRFPENKGQSDALVEGFHLSRGNTVVSMDGDLQFDPHDIPMLLERLQASDVVCGWRQPRRDEWQRRFLSFLAYLVRYAVLGDRIHDSGCTFRAYRRRCVENLNLQKGHHRFLPYILRMNGYRVSEIPVNHRERRHGRSKYGIFRLWDGIRTLLTLWFAKRVRSGNTSPIHQ